MVPINECYNLRFIILLLTSFPTLFLYVVFFVMQKRYFYYPDMNLVMDSSEIGNESKRYLVLDVQLN